MESQLVNFMSEFSETNRQFSDSNVNFARHQILEFARELLYKSQNESLNKEVFINFSENVLHAVTNVRREGGGGEGGREGERGREVERERDLRERERVRGSSTSCTFVIKHTFLLLYLDLLFLFLTLSPPFIHSYSLSLSLSLPLSLSPFRFVTGMVQNPLNSTN